MKYQKILGLVATAGLLLAGCATDSDNNSTWLSDPNAVHVSASVGSIFTRSNPTDEAKQTSFNKGDVMGVSNNGKSLNYTFNGTDWQPGNESYLVWDASNLKFQCWYPADGTNTFSKGYIQEDQSNADVIAKSDYMTAEVTNLTEIPGNRQLDVALGRKTARLILNIQNFNDQFDASTTKINHIRIASKASTDASETSTVNIKPLQNGEGGINTTYTALVIPGKVEGKLYFSTDESTETPLVVKTGALEAGKSYTYNLIVGKNKVTIGNVTVAEWGTDKIEGGKAEYYPYVTFTAAEAQTFKMKTTGNYNIDKLEYSLDGNNWTAVEKDKEVEFGGAKGSLRLRGKNPNGTASSSVYNYSNITFTHSDVKVACTGDIRTLLDWEYYKTVDTKDARFYYLFSGCKALISAPELPAENLANYCYKSMFYGCSSLQTAPKLPAKTMASECYTHMFNECSSLKKAPELPAETLADGCYASMFQDCYALESAPASLPAKKMASQCYSWMFNGCSSLKVAPELPATELARNCYGGMFFNCKNLTTAPVLSATALVDYCYNQMFINCIKLSSITILAPSTNISRVSFNVKGSKWLADAGTDAGVTSRTLKVKDKDAYDALVTKGLDENWQIGKCTVLDENGMAIK